MKIAIVPVSMMGEQLKLWHSEREVEAAESVLDRRVEGTHKARVVLQNKQQELFDSKARIETARANLARILKKEDK